MTTPHAVQDACGILNTRKRFPAPILAAATAAAAVAADALTHARAALPFHKDADECWSFLELTQALLAERGHEVSIERFDGLGQAQQRLVLRWVPTTSPEPDLGHSSRDYTMEISLPNIGRPTCIFAGCGFDSLDQRREARRDMEHTLRSWFSSFEFESRQMYATFFGRQAS